jgi:phosphate transport system substrate-binding protein
MHKAAEKADRSAEALKFFQWAYKNGQKMAVDMDYVPMPAPVVSQIRQPCSIDESYVLKCAFHS